MEVHSSGTPPSAAESCSALDMIEELDLREDEGKEEDGETSEVSEDGESEREEDYNFQFEGEMDPLSFVEGEDSSRVPLYEVFQQIEDQYKALAAKNRPAPHENESETPAKRLRQEEENAGATREEIEEAMNFGVRKRRRRSRKERRRGRRKGTKNKLNPEVTRKLGDATLHYAQGYFDKAICLLHEVIRLAPNLSDPYHTLGLIYSATDDNKKAMIFYMIAAHLNPKDASLWKLLLAKSIEHEDIKQAYYCLNKAIVADPEDIDLHSTRASLYVELEKYQKAAESYEQIARRCPDNIEVLQKAAQLYQKCKQHERAVSMLEESLKRHKDAANIGVVDLLVSVLMDNDKYAIALEHIEHTQKVYNTGKQMPLGLITKAGICHIHLGHKEKAEACFKVLNQEAAANNPHLIIDVADSLMSVGNPESALTYYLMLEEDSEKYNGYLHLKIARCCVSLKQRGQAIEYYKKAIRKLHDSVDTRMTLSSMLLEEGRDDEAISVLSPPVESDPDSKSDQRKLWHHSGKIKLKLSQIYKSKGLVEAFVDVLFPVIHETLLVEQNQRKARSRPRLTGSVLSERTEVLKDPNSDRVLLKLPPLASSAALSKAARAKKVLQKKAALKEAKRAEALAAGCDYNSDDSDDESQQVSMESPLPGFLNEERNHLLIVDLCKSLSSLRRYSRALGIVKISLKLDALPVQIKKELRTIGAQLEALIADPAHGWDLVRDFVSRDPYSFSAWNHCYKVILRMNRLSRRNKLLHSMRVKHTDSIPPILITGHQFTMISQHQTAAREYLHAYKLMPDNPLINLCGGTALINLSLGLRLQNKHQTFLQGLAFLYNNLRLCGDSQEALYNIARAYHHVGLVSLAAQYYEKALTTCEKDYPIPTLPYENQNATKIKMSGYCDLRREAAYNLHLIYKQSGAFDLARQVLKDHLVL
ncbi:general transcription factor 3C polypeptide 3-like [Salvia splendens]|uniref:general transcription factor 3C polypeptide 3-like n=1 Tax=Salvia splendens TaxID=180675 RepID=UPI001C26AD62|nr:general transcription factor 3C polypeptide 3-like [Salvia splendens]XP_042014356.1 general transcription factor 3C polypeptide 3-like [Salvia splendens]